MSKALGCLDVIYRYVNAYCPTLFNFEFNEIKKDLEILKDIEEELGIDLSTLFKALKYGCLLCSK